MTRDDGLSAVVGCVPIKAGEEVTLCYGKRSSTHGLPRWWRRAYLFWRYGFICRCELCSDNSEEMAKRAEERAIRQAMLEIEEALVREGIDEVLSQAGVTDFIKAAPDVDVAIWEVRYFHWDVLLVLASSIHVLFLVPFLPLVGPYLKVVMPWIATRCALVATAALFCKSLNEVQTPAMQLRGKVGRGGVSQTSASALAPVTSVIIALLVAAWDSRYYHKATTAGAIALALAVAEWTLTFRLRRSISFFSLLQIICCKAALTWALPDYWVTLVVAWAGLFLYALTVEELVHDPDAATSLNVWLPQNLHIDAKDAALSRLENMGIIR